MSELLGTEHDLDEAFGDACNALFLVLKRGRGTVGTRADGASLSESQIAMLESVAKNGPLGVKAIADLAGVAQPTVSRMLNALEKQGVVVRSPSPQDERAVLVELTESGRQLWESKRALLRYFQRDALLRFAPDRRVEVVEMLRELTAIIEDQIAER
ncbi:MarR family winged helix-turn-helix transcriptional regulator [Rhodococcus sp. NPDC078407]|uniref:MarR family winged helix-turn-helix transcriptional regulator n=1 Tax=Rhodococcus sp. NPDC078407 TaxID=3364509 RepID=UPI0037C7E3F9